MGNFKVKTNGNNASEVIDMLILIGKKPITTKEGLLSEIAMGTSMLVDTGNGLFTTCGDYDVEEITLAELRDMVVLKRNDVNDATHENSIFKYFKACDDWYYFDLDFTDKWQKSAGAKPEYYEKLKPIEKTMNILDTGRYEQPSLNDQYAEIEQARQAVKAPDGNDSDHTADAMAYAFMGVGRDKVRQHRHYFIDVSDVDEIDFYEIALRYNVTDPCIQHILKKCLAVGQRGQKDFHHDLKDIYDTAKRMLDVHGLDP